MANESILINGKTVYKSEYMWNVKSYGRATMLRLLHTVGLKQGNAKRSDSDLALILWNHAVLTSREGR